MSQIKIEDLKVDENVSNEELKKVFGGLYFKLVSFKTNTSRIYTSLPKSYASLPKLGDLSHKFQSGGCG